MHNFYKIIGHIEYPVGAHMTDNKPIIEDMASSIAKVFPDKDYVLWCRGSSGAIIAGILSYLLPNKTSINHIKKEGEYSHSNMVLVDNSLTNIIVDDLIASGTTIDAILEKMIRSNISPDALCVSGEIPRLFGNIENYFGLKILNDE
jgi:adenine/guanine phosphoribosyltransferase-like PRPP-binding protein